MTPFDDALEYQELDRAAYAYASARGEPGSPEYKAAWFRFRKNVKTRDDLRRVRDRAALRRERSKQATRTA